MKKILLFILIYGTCYSQEILHVEGGKSWKKTPFTGTEFNKNIKETAVKYAWIPLADLLFENITFRHIVYPKDTEEYERLRGYGLLVISAFSHEKGKLPLKKVYLNTESGKKIDLKMILQAETEIDEKDSPVRKTFGAYRSDELYYFPSGMRLENCTLFKEYANNREEKKVADYSNEDIEQIKHLPLTKKYDSYPKIEDLKEFLLREYPGFLNQQ